LEKESPPGKGGPKANCDDGDIWQSHNYATFRSRQGRFLAPEIHSAIARSGRRPITLPYLQFLEDGK
jgi:hypothetical protein